MSAFFCEMKTINAVGGGSLILSRYTLFKYLIPCISTGSTMYITIYYQHRHYYSTFYEAHFTHYRLRYYRVPTIQHFQRTCRGRLRKCHFFQPTPSPRHHRTKLSLFGLGRGRTQWLFEPACEARLCQLVWSTFLKPRSRERIRT